MSSAAQSSAISGVGTKFRRWDADASVPAFDAIAEVNSITGPDATRETIDVTSLDSTGGYREFIASIRDGGTVTLSMNFTSATYAIMKADFDSNVMKSYQIAFRDTAKTAVEFDGLVTGVPFSTITVDDKVTVDVTIKVSGEVDITTHDLVALEDES